ncbi:hypothetical protein BAL199_02019 [alpha proteobacterium BAL199]|nr:hypothetical protein BAL199_02019 [alpha proteobacterium BAL199]
MDNPVYIALSRQTALRRQMSVVANNVANANTTAFKREVMIYQTYAQKAPFTQTMDFVIDQGTATDQHQGNLKVTHNTFDMGINGPGYFQVDDGSGTKYTRNGTFTLDQQNRLVTQDGNPILDTQGNPILIPSGGSDLTVSKDGVIRLGDQLIGRLGIVEFADNRILQKVRDSLFETDQVPEPAQESEVMQGMIETSNVNAITEMTSMIDVHRAYEAAKTLLDREDKRQDTIIQRLARPVH